MIKTFSLTRVGVDNAALFSTRRPGFWITLTAGALALGFTGVTLACFFQMTGRQPATGSDAPRRVEIHYVYATRPLPEKAQPVQLILPDAPPVVEESRPSAQELPDFPLQSVGDPEQSAYQQQLYESVAKALKERSAP